MAMDISSGVVRVTDLGAAEVGCSNLNVAKLLS